MYVALLFVFRTPCRIFVVFSLQICQKRVWNRAMMGSLKIICKLPCDNHPATCRCVVFLIDVIREIKLRTRVPVTTKYPVSGHCRQICPFLNLKIKISSVRLCQLNGGYLANEVTVLWKVADECCLMSMTSRPVVPCLVPSILADELLH